MSLGISPTVEAKIAPQLVANLYAKAAGLLAAKVIVADPTINGYRKLVANYAIDVHGGTCSCPRFVKNAEIADRIETIETEILMANTEKERSIKVKALQHMSPFEGPTCKHLIAAQHLAGLIDIHQEFATFAPAIKREAKRFYDAEKAANETVLATGNPEPRIVPVKRYTPAQPVPLPVPVIEVRGKIDPVTHIQWGVPLSKNGRPPARVMFLCDKDENGQFQAQATEARAQALFPADHYKVSIVVVPASACQYYRPLYATLPC